VDDEGFVFIVVSQHALNAHLAHGDFVTTNPARCGPPPPDDDEPGGGD